MGSFGYRPWESDNTVTALLAILEGKPKDIKTKLLKELRTNVRYIDHESVRYIANYIGRMYVAGLLKDKELIQKAKAVYDYLIDQRDWESWNNPSYLKKLLLKERKMFQ